MRHVLAMSLTATLVGCAARKVDSGSAFVFLAALTIDQLIDIKHPSNPIWSPDGAASHSSGIAQAWPNLYVRRRRRGRPARVDELHEWRGWRRVLEPRWQPALFPARRRSLAGRRRWWRRRRQCGRRRLPEAGIVLSPDGRPVAFVRGGTELWIQVTRPTEREARVAEDARSIGNITWSPDAAHLALCGWRQTRSATSRRRTIRAQDHLHHHRAHAGTGIRRRARRRQRRRGDRDAGRRRRPLARPRRVVFDRQSPDYKRRTIYVADIASGQPRALREDVDEKFWSITGDAGSGAQPSPDGKWIAFVSDRDGWDHLYVMSAGGGDAVQITKGEVRSVAADVVA